MQFSSSSKRRAALDRASKKAGAAPREGGIPLATKSRRFKMRAATLASETARIRSLLDEVARMHPRDPHGQLAAVWPQLRLQAARGRQRAMADLTNLKYYQVLSLALTDLRALNVRVEGLGNITMKHLGMLFRHWEEKGLAPSTLQSRHSVLRRYFHWMGQTMVPQLPDMLRDKARGVRSTVADKSKAWEAHGLSPIECIAEMWEHCPITALHMGMQHHFGLRVSECFQVDTFKGGLLVTHLPLSKGTKGGRYREVPLDTQERQDFLLLCQAYAQPNTGRVQYRTRQSLAQALNHYKYMVSKHGFTKKGKGVTSHGMRHGYGQALYKAKTGANAPVNGGLPVDREVDLQARKDVSEAMGHSRTSVTAAYLGSATQLASRQRRNLMAILTPLQMPRTQFSRVVWEQVAAQAHAHREFRFYVTGEHATGNGELGATASPVILAFEAVQQVMRPEGGAEEIGAADAAFAKFAGVAAPLASKLLRSPVIFCPTQYLGAELLQEALEVLPLQDAGLEVDMA